ncbi:MAG: hypothetical protein CMD08_01205 [Flavobacteriales bacterium]|nr:hypothetical protein [Flavobacteriales bacterium]
MKKIFLISFFIGLFFSIFYIVSSSLVCKFVFDCSIELENYIWGAMIITFSITLIISLILGVLWYIYKATKV